MTGSDYPWTAPMFCTTHFLPYWSLAALLTFNSLSLVQKILDTEAPKLISVLPSENNLEECSWQQPLKYFETLEVNFSIHVHSPDRLRQNSTFCLLLWMNKETQKYWILTENRNTYWMVEMYESVVRHALKPSLSINIHECVLSFLSVLSFCLLTYLCVLAFNLN